MAVPPALATQTELQNRLIRALSWHSITRVHSEPRADFTGSPAAFPPSRLPGWAAERCESCSDTKSLCCLFIPCPLEAAPWRLSLAVLSPLALQILLAAHSHPCHGLGGCSLPTHWVFAKKKKKKRASQGTVWLKRKTDLPMIPRSKPLPSVYSWRAEVDASCCKSGYLRQGTE